MNITSIVFVLSFAASLANGEMLQRHSPLDSGPVRGRSAEHGFVRHRPRRSNPQHHSYRKSSRNDYGDRKSGGRFYSSWWDWENEEHVTGVADSGNCKPGSASTSTIQVMTFNTFLIKCLFDAYLCEEESEREARIERISDWFKDRNEDVVLFQEVWSFHDELKNGMADAGFCHFAINTEGNGSGLAIFSKFPVVKHDFVDWYDIFGIGDGLNPGFNPEANLWDKGGLYAKIQKDSNTDIHLFNLHTSSDTQGDAHSARMDEFDVLQQFVASQDIPPNELVLMGGDFNEDKYCRENTNCPYVEDCENQAYYNEMLSVLSADTPALVGDLAYTYDTTVNKILMDLYAEEECYSKRYLLDYIFFSTNHLVPNNDNSSCEIVFARDPSGEELSDHLPVTCTFHY